MFVCLLCLFEFQNEGMAMELPIEFISDEKGYFDLEWTHEEFKLEQKMKF